MPSETSRATDAYSAGVSHYSSPTRRDQVKRKWEEPVTSRIIQRAFDLTPAGAAPRVVDIGCGSGEGLRLIEKAAQESGGPGPVSYCGIDLDDRLLALARENYTNRPDTEFRLGDMRTEMPLSAVDLYFSCGVPYSHLTKDDTTATIREIMSRISRNGTRSAIVIDVLGRYSIEWEENWGTTRWDYRMNFFENGETADPTPMTFWSSDELISTIASAAGAERVHLSSLECFDRSIMVGRHTVTGEYNRRIPPYRTLINRLEVGGDDVAVADLMFPEIEGDTPIAVSTFQQEFGRQWNAALLDICGRTSEVPRRVGTTLAARLREIEWKLSPGLGVGHSLSAVVSIDGSI
jgi:SAM-dependent methyltransferase